MFRIASIFLFLIISLNSFSQDKKILFRGDSIWYAAKDQMLFSSTNHGLKWDTIFAKKNPPDTAFFNGVLDTATNVFISDQRTLFVFGWDGTFHYKTVLYSSSNYGKTWVKAVFHSANGMVGVKYFHKASSDKFFLYLRHGYYSISEDAGETWKQKCIVNTKFGCFDDRFTIDTEGNLRIGYSRDKACKTRTIKCSKDGGFTWQ